jgi:hypothetical protein
MAHTLSQDVEVPGGQQMFVLSSGEVGYTVAHSAVIPDGGVTSGFILTPLGHRDKVGATSFPLYQ